MSPTHSTVAGDWRASGQSRARLRLPGSWISDNIWHRALLPALFCLCLSSKLFICHAQPAAQSERLEPLDQLKGMLIRRMADGFLAAGEVARWLGRSELAVPLYTSAHDWAVAGYGAASSVAATAIMSRAESFSDLGRLEQALRDKDRLVRMKPDEALSYESRAITLSRLRRYSEALQDYETSLQLDPVALSANIGRAVVLRHLGRLPEARNAYSQAIEVNLRLADAQSQEARLYTLRGLVSHDLIDYQAAIDDFSRALRMQPGWLRHYSRGRSYYATGDYNRAIADYGRAIDLNPRADYAFYGRGSAYLKLERYEQALADYTRAVELDRTSARSYVSRAITYGELGRPDKAFADYEEALRVDPSHIDAYRNRGWLYEQRGQPDLALQDYQEALKFSPDDAWLRRAFARLSNAQREGILR